ncbi:MAG: PaaI family thioesterase, partial [Ottowia sp.]|nr:PaaI family thioesterase [Ottowia sp.]
RPAPVTPGVPLVGRGRLLHRTRSMAFVEGSVLDAEGRLCAQSTGTFKYVPRAERPDHARGPLPTD